MGVVAAAVLLAGIGGGAFWALTAPEASAAQIRLESVSSSGSLPFGAPAGNDDPDVQAPDNAGGQLPGNTGGLYAGGAGGSPCDAGALVAGVTSDPAKAAAWAAPMGIAPGRIGSFVGSLSAVTLRADTAVTQYGYAAGQFQPYPAVLQAGTAVLVNRYGEPTVKCYNANPLGAPTESNTPASTDGGVVVGTPWPGYAVERTVTVVPAPAPQKRFEVVDPTTDTQKPEEVPPRPPDLPATPNPAPPTTPDKQLLLTGVHNYDGTVTLSDGRIMRQDESIVKPVVEVTHPPGSTTLKDGAIQHPDGRVFNVNGTERRPITVAEITVNPNGTTVPLIANIIIKFNYDGSFLAISPGKPGAVTMIDDKGQEVPPNPAIPVGSRVEADGTVTTPEGKILNPNGQERPPKVILPGDVVLDPRGGNTPSIEKQTTVDPNKPEVELVEPAPEQQEQAGGQGGTPPGNGGVVPPAEKGGPVAPPLGKDENPVVPVQGGDAGTAGTGTKTDCTATPTAAGCQKEPASKPAAPVEPGTGETGQTGQTGGDGGGSTGGGTGDGGGTSGGGTGDGGGGSGGGAGGGNGGGGGDGGGN